jgi:hypothetical protein
MYGCVNNSCLLYDFDLKVTMYAMGYDIYFEETL